MSSDFWQNNLESSHLEGGESRSICFLGKVAADDRGREDDGDGWINRLFVLCNILGDIYRLSTELVSSV